MLSRRLAIALTGLLAASTAALGLAPATATAAVTHDPVVTVYGFGGNSSQFDPIKTSLKAAGWSSTGFYDFGYIGTNANAQTGGELKKFVDGVKARTGAKKVDLLVHSMGAISSRYYLKALGGSTSVDAWIAMGGADKGTTIAGLCAPLFAACADMVPGSKILTYLNTGDPTPGRTRYFTFYSSCDGVITPYTNILVDTATNIDAGCVSHNNYFSTPLVQNDITLILG